MKKWMFVPAVGLLLMLAACSGGWSVTNRFRVIATVDVDGQKVEGSTVMEIKYWRGGTTLKGEALIFDLKGRGTVYVLPYAHDLSGELGQVYEYGVLNSLGIENSIGSLSSQDFDRVRQARGRIPFQNGNPTRLPAFVAFRDEKNPKTIYEVGPRNFGQSFPGVRFVGLDIEFTDAPVTKVLKQRLPWLKNRNDDELFDRDPPGRLRAARDTPIGFKISTFHFFGLGSL
jgi:hypothetical protein